MRATRTTAHHRAGARGVLAVLGAAALSVAALVPPPAGAAPAAPLERVVVTSAAGAADAARAVVRAGGSVLERLSLVPGVVAALPADAALPPSYVVAQDRPLSVVGRPSSGDGPSSTVRSTLGLGAPADEGRGTVVAVVDTGVADLPDLAGRLTHVGGEGTGDGYGHGTFIAGLIASDGSSSGGRYAGVAPGASILDVKVSDDEGRTSLVRVLRGLQAAADRGADVVNLSLASGSPLPYQVDPLTVALEELWRRGTVVVVPAGNDGSEGDRTIASPGLDPVLLTVGGLDEGGSADRRDDTVAAWSSRGPAPQRVAKPDLVAPGTSLVSLQAPGSVVARTNPDARVGDRYLLGSGTSFATAVTAGAAAVLRAERPQLVPDEVKSLLVGTAYDARGLRRDKAAGAGGLDLARALTTRLADVPRLAADPVDAAPGDPAVWQSFLDAVLRGDRAGAAAAWDRLSPAARNWAAGTWSAGSWSARRWALQDWEDGGWGGDEDASAREWAARNWAARNWAARNWAADSWSAGSWSARNWAARNWAARNWAARNWAAVWGDGA